MYIPPLPSLSKLPLGVLCEGPHAVRLDCAVNLNRLFNERFSLGNMSPVAFKQLLLAAGVALSLEDSNSVSLSAVHTFPHMCSYMKKSPYI